jgi:uncharacterized membrane protein YecN with MAPEG domain
MPHITALYAGLLGLMAIAIAFRAGSLRTKLNVPVGDGGHPELLVAMRRHANFVEFVPLALILIGLLEMNGVGALAIHLFGGGLVLFRICHAVGINAESTRSVARGIGAGGSTLVIVVASIWAIVTFF